MKFDEMCDVWRKRYSVEQEKKQVVERLHRERLKNAINEIICLTVRTIEYSGEALYCAYETAKNMQEKELMKNSDYRKCKEEEIQILFHVWEGYIDYSLKFNMISGPHTSIIDSAYSTEVFVNRFNYDSSVFTKLDEILKSYSDDRSEIVFVSRIKFDLRKNQAILSFSGKCHGDWKVEGCERTKKFISDMREVFSISTLEEIPEPEVGSYSNVDLDITIDCSKFDIIKFEKDTQNVEINTIEQAILEMPIEELNVCTRAYNVLKNRLKISTVGELMQISEQTLNAKRGMGPKTLSDLKTKLSKLGVSLKA